MSEISKLEQSLIIKKIDPKNINIQITNNEVLKAIVGQFNQNLKYLEKLTKTNVFFRGNSITCKGQKEYLEVFSQAIRFLVNKFLLTNIIEKEDIVLSIKNNMTLDESNIKSFSQLIKTPRKSVIARSTKESNVESFKQLIKTPKKSVIARSEKQSEYIKVLKENEIVMSLGPAGTGKSFLAVSVAITLLLEKKVERVRAIKDFNSFSALKVSPKFEKPKALEKCNIATGQSAFSQSKFVLGNSSFAARSQFLFSIALIFYQFLQFWNVPCGILPMIPLVNHLFVFENFSFRS